LDRITQNGPMDNSEESYVGMPGPKHVAEQQMRTVLC